MEAAYIFGSASTGAYRENSDIDLIFVKDGNLGPFVERALLYDDILDLFPRMDILVYTPQELEQQLADSDVGFWKSVRLSMKRII